MQAYSKKKPLRNNIKKAERLVTNTLANTFVVQLNNVKGPLSEKT